MPLSAGSMYPRYKSRDTEFSRQIRDFPMAQIGTLKSSTKMNLGRFGERKFAYVVRRKTCGEILV